MNNAVKKYEPIVLYDPKINNGYTKKCEGDQIRSNLLTTDIDEVGTQIQIPHKVAQGSGCSKALKCENCLST
jgi:hypothetical protein